MPALPALLQSPARALLCAWSFACGCSSFTDAAQVLEALALAEPPPEVHDSLKPDHEWMLSTANDELESFRVGS